MSIRSLDPTASHEAMQSEDAHVFVDVRTVEEYDAGHPDGAVNVPWAMLDRASGQMAPNPGFLPTMQKLFPVDAHVYVSCQAGGRSLRACQELEQTGYTNLVNVDGGFGGRRDPTGTIIVQGWKDSGLPVAQNRSDYESSKA